MSEAKTLTLTIGERLAAMKLFDAFKGSITQLASILDDVKLFSVTDEEWTKANLTKTPTDEEITAMSAEEKKEVAQTWKWDENDATAKTIEVQVGTLEYLKSEIKKKSDAGEVTLADRPLLSLDKKLA